MCRCILNTSEEESPHVYAEIKLCIYPFCLCNISGEIYRIWLLMGGFCLGKSEWQKTNYLIIDRLYLPSHSSGKA